MLKKYIAIVKNKKGIITNIKSDYSNKKDFEKDLKLNEYKVLKVFTENQIEYIKKTDFYDLMSVNNYNKTIDICYEYIKECL